MYFRLEDIYINNKSKKILSKAIIDINKVGIYLIKGKNGSGKTTIAKTLFNSYPKLISLMLQENDLIFKDISILDNIDMYQDKKDKILNVLKKYNLTYLIEKNSKYLSGGEKRVISLLRILFSDRKIIILDEPSNDIDYKVFARIYELIKEFSRKKAIVIISHDDRFDEYVKKYEIKDGELCLLEEVNKNIESIDELEYTNIKKIKNNNKNHNFIFYFCFIISLIFFIYSILNNFHLLKNEESYSKYKKGLYHISSLMGTNISEFNDLDSLNTTLIKSALKKNKLQYFNELDNESKRLEIGLEFHGDTIEKVYPQQFYNLDSKSYYDIEEKMEEEILKNINNQNINISYTTFLKDFLNSDEIPQPQVILPLSLKNQNILDYFQKYEYDVIFENDINDTIFIDFNEMLYNETLLKYSENNEKNITTEAIVKIKDNVEFLDFIIESGFDKQSFLIQGYELYLLNIEINNFNIWKIIIKTLIIYFILIIALLYVVINIYEVSNSKKYRNYYYYGFPISEINRYQKDYYLIRYFSVFACSITLITAGCIFVLYKSYIMIVTFLLYICCLNIIIIIIRKFLKVKLRRLIK
ncbi:ATP-binding cassette domain-containing protein [Clostridium tertium]|uniref:Cytochrome c biogenesis ATP-binding export protein CcmA n=1 Tax=Clostridium tertium TaxID=1559 RepID=A0A6N3GXE7_9CLOT